MEEMIIFSHATTNKGEILKLETSYAKLEQSIIEDAATASVLSGEVPKKSTRRVLYASLSSLSSSGSTELECSSESDISDSHFSGIVQKCWSSDSDTSHVKFEPSIIEDATTASIFSGEGPNLPEKSTRRFLYTSLSSSSSSESTESECSSESDISDSHFSNQSANAESLSAGNMQKCWSSDSDTSHVKFEPSISEDATTASIPSGKGPNLPEKSTRRFLYTSLSSSSASENSESECSSNSSESYIFDSDSYSLTLNELMNDFKETFNSVMASKKLTNTHNWVQNCNMLNFEESSEEEMGACSNATKTEHAELGTDLEEFVWGSKRRYKKYWKMDEVLPDSNLDAPKEEAHSERMCKVTFAPDDVLVTVHTFEREPEELLPDTFELDRIRFQMRISSFSVLMVPFLTMEHRIQIMQRNGLNQNEF